MLTQLAVLFATSFFTQTHTKPKQCLSHPGMSSPECSRTLCTFVHSRRRALEGAMQVHFRRMRLTSRTFPCAVACLCFRSRANIPIEDAVASPPVAAVTVAVAADSLPAADEVASATVEVAAVVAVALATAVDEEAAVVRPVEDVELPAVVEVTVAAVEVPVVERTSNLSQTLDPSLITLQQGHCRAPSPRRCLRRSRKGGSARHQELDPRRERLRREAHQRRSLHQRRSWRGFNPQQHRISRVEPLPIQVGRWYSRWCR
jgi:hypothetical protein